MNKHLKEIRDKIILWLAEDNTIIINTDVLGDIGGHRDVYDLYHKVLVKLPQGGEILYLENRYNHIDEPRDIYAASAPIPLPIVQQTIIKLAKFDTIVINATIYGNFDIRGNALCHNVKVKPTPQTVSLD